MKADNKPKRITMDAILKEGGIYSAFAPQWREVYIKLVEGNADKKELNALKAAMYN
jgi:hypothetical protein